MSKLFKNARPCPFCGSEDIDFSFYESGQQYVPRCNGCGIEGKAEYTKETVLLAWNKRYAEPCGQCELVGRELSRAGALANQNSPLFMIVRSLVDLVEHLSPAPINYDKEVKVPSEEIERLVSTMPNSDDDPRHATFGTVHKMGMAVSQRVDDARSTFAERYHGLEERVSNLERSLQDCLSVKNLQRPEKIERLIKRIDDAELSHHKQYMGLSGRVRLLEDLSRLETQEKENL